jgi:hypothetical protein
VPLEFLRRRGGGRSTPAGLAPTSQMSSPLPEEATAQSHQLRLNFAARTSEGVRMQANPVLVAHLAEFLRESAKSEIEVIEPRPTELASASPSIVRSEEAAAWLTAHGALSPITRHALWVLESLDAIDPTYDTFAVALLDGDVDTSGYPDYSAIVGGIAAHWDESTGDLILRAVVGWGGRGARGDTDRTAGRILGRLLNTILDSGEAIGRLTVERRAVGGGGIQCPHCGYAAATKLTVFCPKCGMRMSGSE